LTDNMSKLFLATREGQKFHGGGTGSNAFSEAGLRLNFFRHLDFGRKKNLGRRKLREGGDLRGKRKKSKKEGSKQETCGGLRRSFRKNFWDCKKKGTPGRGWRNKDEGNRGKTVKVALDIGFARSGGVQNIEGGERVEDTKRGGGTGRFGGGLRCAVQLIGKRGKFKGEKKRKGERSGERAEIKLPLRLRFQTRRGEKLMKSLRTDVERRELGRRKSDPDFETPLLGGRRLTDAIVCVMKTLKGLVKASKQ